MASPTPSSSSSLAAPASLAPPHTNSLNTHFNVSSPKNFRLSRLRSTRTSTLPRSYPGWEVGGQREPYHAYVHKLVEAGWDNLKPLDDYMSRDVEDADLVISVLDILDDELPPNPAPKLHRHADLHDEAELSTFLHTDNRAGVKARLILAEQQGPGLASGVIETLGASLKLDPRFFQWNIFDDKHLLSPSERHRAPFTSVGFTVPKEESTRTTTTETEFFRVGVYVQPDEEGGDGGVGGGWTGVLLFNSHTKINMSVHTLATPPTFSPAMNEGIIPSLTTAREPNSFRELYLSTFDFIDIKEAAVSPFYCIHPLLRLNSYCWNKVINNICDEDRRLNGISEGQSVYHVAEIKKSLAVVERGGSLRWGLRFPHPPLTEDTKARLEEDFKHLLEQSDFLWEQRRKMAAVRQRQADARTNALTNSFTYFFVPISLVSSIYGMNVSQISGSSSNPNIWQFFVATMGVNVLILAVLALTNWIHILQRRSRRAGMREILGFAVGRHPAFVK